ncbi:MAG: NMD3-related protein [Candidatus Micrarchaeota archaeon]
MSALVCPKCGRTSDAVAFIEAFCIDDYPVRIEAPAKAEFERCTRCGRMRLRGEWTPFSEKKVAGFILSRCRGEYESAEFDAERGAAVFTLRSGAKIARPVAVEMKKTICQQCSRIAGGYFEAIIQLRGDRAKQEKYAEMFLKRLDKVTFVTRTEEKDEGLDLYIGNSKAVVEMMGKMGLKVLMTKKLVGRDQGKRLYRTTFLIRL